jgi:hypothetical protein
LRAASSAAASLTAAVAIAAVHRSIEADFLYVDRPFALAMVHPRMARFLAVPASIGIIERSS